MSMHFGSAVPTSEQIMERLDLVVRSHCHYYYGDIIDYHMRLTLWQKIKRYFRRLVLR